MWTLLFCTDDVTHSAILFVCLIHCIKFWVTWLGSADNCGCQFYCLFTESNQKKMDTWTPARQKLPTVTEMYLMCPCEYSVWPINVEGERCLTCTEPQQSWRLSCFMRERNERKDGTDWGCDTPAWKQDEGEWQWWCWLKVIRGSFVAYCIPGDQHHSASSPPHPTPKSLRPTVTHSDR